MAIEKRPTNRSDELPLGTVTDGAVRLVELALPCPLLASTGVTVEAPMYARIPPAASFALLKLQV